MNCSPFGTLCVQTSLVLNMFTLSEWDETWKSKTPYKFSLRQWTGWSALTMAAENNDEIITDLVMRHEQHQLHEWEKRNIFVKNKGTEVVQLVSETILSLRRFLIDQKIIELQEQTKLNIKNDDILQDILSYQQLKKVISKRLNRVL